MLVVLYGVTFGQTWDERRNRGPVTGRCAPIWSAGRPAATRAATPPNGAALRPNSGGHLQKIGRPPPKIGRPVGPPQVWAGRPRWPQGRHQGGHPQIEGGPNVAAAGQMGRPWWPGGRPCGSRAAGGEVELTRPKSYQGFDALNALHTIAFEGSSLWARKRAAKAYCGTERRES